MMPGTILIVDDERMERETIESILDGQGYNLEFAEDGHQAIEKARTIQPDAILLDVMMPGMSGFEVCSIIRNTQSIAETHIIVLTALDDRDAKLRGLQAGQMITSLNLVTATNCARHVGLETTFHVG